MIRPFRRRASGITARLSGRELDLLRVLPDLLDAVGQDDGDDPAARRLDPPAHRDDPEAAEAYRELVAGDLAKARGGDRRALLATLERTPVVLDDAEAEAWLRVIGEARLVIAARMGIVDDYDWSDRRLAEGPDGAVLQYLSYLQEGLVGVLGESLPTT